MATKSTTAEKLPKGLWQHRNGQYAAKIKGDHRYFGTDRARAIRRFEHERPYLRRGEAPPPLPGEEPDPETYVSIDRLVNEFLAHKAAKVEAGDLGRQMFESYRDVSRNLIQVFGRSRDVDDLRREDFRKLSLHLAKQYSVQSRANRITWIKSIFAWGERNELLEHAPRYGDEFDRPRQEKLDLHRLENHKTFSAAELRAILEEAGQPLKALLLLAYNGALGQHDLANLRWSDIDLDNSWLNYPRSKTAGARQIPLWAETVEALREWRGMRPAPADSVDDKLVFLTCNGRRFVRFVESRKRPGHFGKIDGIGQEFNKLQLKAKAYQAGRAFYCIRHSIAGVMFQSGDSDATKAIMGHKDGSMLRSHYVLGFPDKARLQKIINYIHDWLFAKPK
jgi:integrase